MSEFDRFLCQCKPLVMNLLAMQLKNLKPEEVDFVLRHEDWRIEQFLSLVVSTGMQGAMRYLHNYGGRDEVVAGMDATLDLEQIVSQRFAEGNAYTYLQIATWISQTHKICLDYSLKDRINKIVRTFWKRGQIIRLAGGTPNVLAVYSAASPVESFAALSQFED
jgi:hypothetical protein